MREFTWDRDDPLGRNRHETRKAHTALIDYWMMGPGRSLRKLHREYSETSSQEPPTRVLRTLLGWSTRYAWQARVDQAKKVMDDEIVQAEIEARRAKVLSSGYALHFERVAHLKILAELLRDELLEDDKRWLPDVKQIGQGESAERVDIVRFNARLVEQYRRTLDDIAAELGERVKGLRLSGAVGVASVTADDLAQARDEAEEWERNRFGDLDTDDE